MARDAKYTGRALYFYTSFTLPEIEEQGKSGDIKKIVFAIDCSASVKDELPRYSFTILIVNIFTFYVVTLCQHSFKHLTLHFVVSFLYTH